MKKDFITHWRSLDRKARRKLVQDFIASKKQTHKVVEKKDFKRVKQTNTFIRKPSTFALFKRKTFRKPILAFSFAPPSDSSGGGGEISDSSEERYPTDKKQERKPSLNFRKKPNRKEKKVIDSRRSLQKQRLIEFIKKVRADIEADQSRRREEAEIRRRVRQEAKKQAILKLEAEKAAKLEAEKVRRQQLIRAKIEKVQEKKALQEARRKQIEQRRKEKELKLEQLRQERERALEVLRVKRQQQKQRLIEFIRQSKERYQLEQLRQKETKERLAKEKPVFVKVPRESLDLRPIRREKLLAFLKELKEKRQKELAQARDRYEALKKQKEISAIASRQERQAKAIQIAEFRARQKQLALQKKQLLKAEILLAAKKKQQQAEAEKARKEFERNLKEFSTRINSSVSGLQKTIAALLGPIVSSVSAAVKKAKGMKIPQAASFVQVPEITPVPVKAVKPAVKPEKKKYKEPIKLGPFLRKNAFRFLFFLLLLIWLGEILFYTMRWQPPRERFEEMFETEKSKSEKQTTAIAFEEVKTEEYKVPTINIEGKRDPFSGGVLTMELMKKPRQAEIMLAYKPEIITIKKKPSIVSQPEQKPVREKPEKITPILKPEKPEPPLPSVSETTVSRILPPSPVSKPEVSPLIVPQVECPLVYRGRLVMEGIEYIFLEGKQRTYRVTVGDVVEGFRILKKEKGVLTLSKEGIIVEIPAE